MIDNIHTGGAAYVRLASSPEAFHAEAIRGTWNGWLVPAFAHSEAWAILTAHGFEFGDDVNGNIHYTDASGEATRVTLTNDGLHIFDGWTWESAEVSRQTVDVATLLIVSNLDMDIITGAIMDTVEAWLAPHAGGYANNEARHVLDVYSYLIEDEVNGWDGSRADYPRSFAHVEARA